MTDLILKAVEDLQLLQVVNSGLTMYQDHSIKFISKELPII